MANTYTWVIDSMDVIPSSEGQTNVVSCARYHVNATDGIHNTVIYSDQPLQYVFGSPFTNYNNLTQTTVIKWIQDTIGSKKIESIQTSLDNQIINLANSSTITQSLPWTN